MKPKLEFRIHGMDCAEEVAILRREVGPVAGGEDQLAFDLLRGKMIVSGNAPADTISAAVARAGMRAERWSDVVPEAGSLSFWQRRGRTALTVVSGVFTMAGFVSHATLAGGISAAFGSEGLGLTHHVPPLTMLLYAVGIVLGSWYIAPKALLAAKRMRPDMNLLMVLAVVGAVFIDEWFEAATVSFLFAVSLTLESWSVGRARRAVEALMAVAPATVRLKRDGRDIEVPTAEAAVGEFFTVRPGERIGLDGVVIKGSSEVNQAPITGESLPVTKEPGNAVFAGSINGSGVVEIEVTKLAGETTLAQIIRMIGEAQTRRAPSEQWVEKFARVYTPIVFAIAILVGLIPPLFGGDWSAWGYRALVLLVIGCPCALVISTPVSIVASLAAAAKNGVLIKGGVHVETPARLRVIAFDKTGTITAGEPSVVEVVPMSGHSEAELLERVGAMEVHSDHPLARAIMDYIRERKIETTPADEFRILPGKGAVARFKDKNYWLGSHRFLEERAQETPEVHDRLVALADGGRTVVVVGNDTHVCGFIALSDRLRPGIQTVISTLSAQGVRHIVMLTGDNRGTAERMAKEAGIKEVRADLLPADKVTIVEDLVRSYGQVAMVGDGVNDAPAMSRASLGIAMGAAGSDTAIEAADVALMADDLTKLPWLIAHSRRTLSIIQQNIWLSLGVKALFAALTLLGHASLWSAIAADMGVSLLVIFNALRLLARNQLSRPQQLG
jgi:Cd2+/Zn2+-exporting ATPase